MPKCLVMSRLVPLALLLSSLVFAACNKQDVAPTTPRCTKFVAGDVAIGVSSNVAIEALFTQMNALGLRIDQVSGFAYISGLPADSLAYVKRTLLAKPYLTAKGFKGGAAAVYADGKIHVTDLLFDMSPAKQADWLHTLQQLQLTDETGTRCQTCKTVLLKVPAGSEQRWVDELAKQPTIRWAELNCYSQIKLH